MSLACIWEKRCSGCRIMMVELRSAARLPCLKEEGWVVGGLALFA
jgi:hypothetical protein